MNTVTTESGRRPAADVRILDALRKYHPLPLTVEDLVAETGASHKTVRIALSPLLKSGVVRRDAVQMYANGALVPHFWLVVKES